jgi:hypothetical protein
MIMNKLDSMKQLITSPDGQLVLAALTVVGFVALLWSLRPRKSKRKTDRSSGRDPKLDVMKLDRIDQLRGMGKLSDKSALEVLGYDWDKEREMMERERAVVDDDILLIEDGDPANAKRSIAVGALTGEAVGGNSAFIDMVKHVRGMSQENKAAQEEQKDLHDRLRKQLSQIAAANTGSAKPGTVRIRVTDTDGDPLEATIAVFLSGNTEPLIAPSKGSSVVCFKAPEESAEVIVRVRKLGFLPYEGVEHIGELGADLKVTMRKDFIYDAGGETVEGSTSSAKGTVIPSNSAGEITQADMKIRVVDLP